MPSDPASEEFRTDPHRVNIVDTKLPLTWLISTGAIITLFLATTLWNVSMQSNKLDQLVLSTSKIESNVSTQDTKLDKLKENSYATQRVIDNLQNRIEALERSVRK